MVHRLMLQLPNDEFNVAKVWRRQFLNTVRYAGYTEHLQEVLFHVCLVPVENPD